MGTQKPEVPDYQTTEIHHIPPSELTPNPWGDDYNPKLSKGEEASLRASLSASEIRHALTVCRHDGEMIVVCGCNRLRLAIELGYETVPVVFREFASEEEAMALALEDNSTAVRRMHTAIRAEQAVRWIRLKTVGHGHRTDLAPQHSSEMKKVDVYSEASKLYDVSAGTISKMRKLLASGDDELLRDVRKKKLSLSKAVSQLTASNPQADAAEGEQESASKHECSPNASIADFEKFLENHPLDPTEVLIDSWHSLLGALQDTYHLVCERDDCASFSVDALTEMLDEAGEYDSLLGEMIQAIQEAHDRKEESQWDDDDVDESPAA